MTKDKVEPNIQKLVSTLDSLSSVLTISSSADEDDLEQGQCGPNEFYVNFILSYSPSGWASLDTIVKACDQHRFVEIVPWYDAGIVWGIRGKYSEKSEINDLVDLIKELDEQWLDDED